MSFIPNDKSNNIPLDSLVLKLKSHGFKIGIVEYAKIQEVLLLFGKEYYNNLSELKLVLCPIIANSKKDQKAFYQIFDEYINNIYRENSSLLRKIEEQRELEKRNFSRKKETSEKEVWQFDKGFILKSLFIIAILLIPILINYKKDPPQLKPIINISDDTIYVGETIDIIGYAPDSTNSTEHYQFHWFINNQPIQYEEAKFSPKISKKFTEKGSYTIRLKAFPIGLKEISFVKDTTIVVVCKDEFNIDFDYISNNKKVVFNLNDTTNLYTYNWDFGDGNTLTDVYNPTHNFQEFGNYTVIVTAARNDQITSCDIATSTKNITIDPSNNKIQIYNLGNIRVAKDVLSNRSLFLLFIALVLIIILTECLIYVFNKLKGDGISDLLYAIKKAKKPPFTIPFPSQTQKIKTESQLLDLIYNLRQRVKSENIQFNIRKTINETIKNHGFVTLKYNNVVSHLPEYLILIERGANLNQQYWLFNYLVELFAKEEILVESFYFNFEPKICRNDSYPEGIGIKELYLLYPSHKLLIFSKGEQFISKDGNKLENWVESDLCSWHYRSLLTTKSINDWGYKEKILRQKFIVLPADINGQLELLNYFDLNNNFTFSGLKKQLKKSISLYKFDFDELDDIKLYLQRITNVVNHQDKPSLIHYNQLFKWLKAIAIYPKPYWEMIIVIGKALNFEVNYSNLYILSQINWLKNGKIPQELRVNLLQELDNESELIARKAVLKLLESSIVRNDEYAYEEKETQIIVNKYLIDPEQNQKEGKKLNYLIENNLVNDKALIDYLKKGKQTTLNYSLDSYMAKYKRFKPNMLFQRGLYLSLLFSITLFSLLNLYFVNQHEKRAYDFQNGIVSFNANNFHKAINDFHKALPDTSSIFFNSPPFEILDELKEKTLYNIALLQLYLQDTITFQNTKGQLSNLNYINKLDSLMRRNKPISTILINGLVVDQKGIGINNVIISINDNKYTETNNFGNFELLINNQLNNFTLTVFKPGYKKFSKLIFDPNEVIRITLDYENSNFNVANINFDSLTISNIILSKAIVCDTEPIQINSSILGNPQRFIWDFGDGSRNVTTNRVQQTIEHSYVNNSDRDTTYIITLTAVNEISTDTFSKAITVIPSDIQASIIGRPYVWEGETFKLATNGYQSYVAISKWNMGNGSQLTSNLDTISYTYENPGTYLVTLNVTTPFCGIISTDSINMTVRPLPDINFEINNLVVCVEEEFEIQNTGSVKHLNTKWDMGDGIIFSGISPGKYSYNTAGNYKITMSLEGTNGGVKRIEKEIVVVQKPNVDFDVKNEIISIRDTIYLQNKSLGAKSYKWTFDETNLSYEENPFIVYATPGRYSINLEGYSFDNQQGCSNHKTKVITVHDRVLPSFDIKTNYSCGVSNIYIENLTPYSNTKDVRFDWEWSDGKTENSYRSLERSFTNYDNTTKDIGLKLIVTTSSGIQDSIEKKITIPSFQYRLNLPDNGVCLAFSPNKKGVGRNSKFRLPFEQKENVGYFSFSLYNQLGLMIYQTNKIEDSWNGKYRKRLVENGVYQGVVEIGDCANKKARERIRFNICVLKEDEGG